MQKLQPTGMHCTAAHGETKLYIHINKEVCILFLENHNVTNIIYRLYSI